MTWSSRLPTANRPGNPYFSADTSAANSPDVINSVFVERGAPPPKKKEEKKERHQNTAAAESDFKTKLTLRHFLFPKKTFKKTYSTATSS